MASIMLDYALKSKTHYAEIVFNAFIESNTSAHGMRFYTVVYNVFLLLLSS